MQSIQKSIWVLTVVIMVTLAGCKTLQETAEDEEVTQPEAVTLVGKTYEGDSVNQPGSTYIESIQPDGTIRGLCNGKDRYKGEWVISSQVWCHNYKGIERMQHHGEKRQYNFLVCPGRHYQKRKLNRLVSELFHWPG